MPAEKIPHLCGGILFGLLLESRRARRKARNKLEGGTDHLSAVDVYAGLIEVVTGDDISAAGRTISKACTLYKTCQTASGVYVPFTERATINAFDAAVRTKNPDLPIRMSEFINNFLNLEWCEWLVRALIETIHLDEDIQENEEFLIDYGTIVCADDLPFVSNVVLEPFLISVLHYVLLNSPDAESGRATFESWYSQSSKNAEWKLQSDIGSSISPLRVYSKLPDAGEKAPADDAPEERMGAAIITRHADTAPDLALYKDGYSSSKKDSLTFLRIPSVFLGGSPSKKTDVGTSFVICGQNPCSNWSAKSVAWQSTRIFLQPRSHKFLAMVAAITVLPRPVATI